MDKTIATIKDLALSIFFNNEYADFMSYINEGKYNSARLYLSNFHNKSDFAKHDELENILINLIMESEDGRGDESEQANRDSG